SRRQRPPGAGRAHRGLADGTARRPVGTSSGRPRARAWWAIASGGSRAARPGARTRRAGRGWPAGGPGRPRVVPARADAGGGGGVVWPHGGGPVGAAGGVLVKGAGAPDVGTAAVDLGVVHGRDAVAMPAVARGRVEQSGEAVDQQGLVPVAGFDERLQGLPVVRPVEGEQGLGDGVLLDVEGQSGDPLDEASPAGGGKGVAEGPEQGLPERPEEGSLHRTPPVRRRTAEEQLLSASNEEVLGQRGPPSGHYTPVNLSLGISGKLLYRGKHPKARRSA